VGAPGEPNGFKMIEHTEAACPPGVYAIYVHPIGEVTSTQKFQAPGAYVIHMEDAPSAFEIATWLTPLPGSALKKRHWVGNAGLE
jgi:hypothetical protein